MCKTRTTGTCNSHYHLSATLMPRQRSRAARVLVEVAQETLSAASTIVELTRSSGWRMEALPQRLRQRAAQVPATRSTPSMVSISTTRTDTRTSARKRISRARQDMLELRVVQCLIALELALECSGTQSHQRAKHASLARSPPEVR